MSIGDSTNAEIDKVKRNNIKLNHSATHLLHSALIKNIGTSVQQKGSLVSDEKLRFDFSCEKPIKREVLNSIEIEVNKNIEKKIPASTKIMNKDQAISAGAIALFGEKYDETVRVLSFGDVSTELCGGTHVNNTGDIGVFKILSESSIASGVRRIEAITGMSAQDYITKRDNLVSDICKTLNVQDEDLKDKINSLVSDNKKLKKENSLLQQKFLHLKILDVITKKKNISDNNIHIIYQEYVDGKILKNILEEIKSVDSKLILTILQKNILKVEIYVLVTKDFHNLINAKQIVDMINEVFGSTGGGREDLAQAGVEFDGDISKLTVDIESEINKLINIKGKIIMPIIVQKYGGTSIGSIEKISAVADKIISEKEKGNDIIVVVSAMSGETNRLIELAKSIDKDVNGREYDVLISTGEQVTISLLAMTLIKKGS